MNDNQTNFTIGATETSETDNTCALLSNDDFMRGIFGDISGSERPVTVSFSGNPVEVNNTKWFGKP